MNAPQARSRRRKLAGSAWRTPLWAGALALQACSFDAGQDSAAGSVINRCESDLECVVGARCRSSMCVMDTTAALAITLAVTPKRMPDGLTPAPLQFGPFTLDGPPKRSFDLVLPVRITGSVRDGSARVAADVDFLPISNAERPPRPVAVTTSETQADTDFSAQLVANTDYQVIIEPLDKARPPHTFTMRAEKDARIEVDYASLPLREQRFRVTGAPADRQLQLRAIDQETGHALSSAARLTDGEATLLFPMEQRAFRLTVSAVDDYALDKANAPTDCDASLSIFPTLTIDEAALTSNAAGDYEVALPRLPSPVRFSGEVQLCAGAGNKSPAGMPMALDAKTLQLDEQSMPVSASYAATSMATVDAETGTLRFCTRVLPGNYVVVVTPPSDVSCEIFAERRVLQAEGGGDISDVVLALRKPAVLSGTIETPDMMPLASASIDAVALGRSEGVLLAEDDPSVATYNRSKQATSDEMGSFRIPVDVGSYDVIIKPPAQSGFAWQVFHDVIIGARLADFATRVTLDTPVLVQGTLRYVGADSEAQRFLAEAEVHAFAVAGEGSNAHTVEIGRTTADENGDVMLLVPSNLRKDGW